MLFEQYPSQDLLTPSIIDGGVNKLDSSLTALDFYLLDDINAYLSPNDLKKTKDELINNSFDDNNQYQEDFFSSFDLSELNDAEETSDFLSDAISFDDIDLEKWISQSSFPSPPMETNSSSISSTENTYSTFPSIYDELSKNIDMVVPPSPPLSSIGSSPAPIIKKPKLTVVERRLRKKDQNKSAAEKYRLKKKSERHKLLDRHSRLKKSNTELKLELENLAYRVQHIKQLFINQQDQFENIQICYDTNEIPRVISARRKKRII
jgi:hypothetical protein